MRNCCNLKSVTFAAVGNLSNLFDRLVVESGSARSRVRDSALQQRGGQTRAARLRSLCSRDHHAVVCCRRLLPVSGRFTRGR